MKRGSRKGVYKLAAFIVWKGVRDARTELEDVLTCVCDDERWELAQ